MGLVEIRRWWDSIGKREEIETCTDEGRQLVISHHHSSNSSFRKIQMASFRFSFFLRGIG